MNFSGKQSADVSTKKPYLAPSIIINYKAKKLNNNIIGFLISSCEGSTAFSEEITQLDLLAKEALVYISQLSVC